MAQVAFSVRMDEGLKQEFSSFCENVGMNMSTAFVVFAKAAVREHRFPFEIAEYSRWPNEEKRQRAINAFREMRSQMKAKALPEPTLDDINALIAETRAERRR